MVAGARGDVCRGEDVLRAIQLVVHDQLIDASVAVFEDFPGQVDLFNYLHGRTNNRPSARNRNDAKGLAMVGVSAGVNAVVMGSVLPWGVGSWVLHRDGTPVNRR